MAETASPEPTPEAAAATIRSKRYIGLLIIAAVIGIAVSLIVWCFLELIDQIQRELFTHLPNALGYHNGPPLWWSLPVLAIGGLIVAFAITRLPGNGGHIPAEGLKTGGAANPSALPGIILAGLGTIGFGVVLGPEAPLIAIGAGVAVLTMRMARRDAPSQVLLIVGAAGSFAAVSFIFTSPLIAAVILIEAAGLGGPRLRVILLPGLLAAGIGTLVSIGMGSFTGLSTSAYALAPLQLPAFHHPNIGQFGWTLAVAIAVAGVTSVITRGGRLTYGFVSKRPLVLLLPVIGLIIAGLAIAFHQTAGKSVNEVLFSGQTALPGLVSEAGTWSISALGLLIVFKGIAYALSLGSFRGGPTFPALFLGTAGGVMASHLPGFPITPAVAVAMSAAVVAVLQLPLSAVVIGTLLTSHAGNGAEPLIIVAVVVSYVVTLLVSAPGTAKPTSEDRAAGKVEPAAPPPSHPLAIS